MILVPRVVKSKTTTSPSKNLQYLANDMCKTLYVLNPLFMEEILSPFMEGISDMQNLKALRQITKCMDLIQDRIYLEKFGTICNMKSNLLNLWQY